MPSSDAVPTSIYRERRERTPSNEVKKCERRNRLLTKGETRIPGKLRTYVAHEAVVHAYGVGDPQFLAKRKNCCQLELGLNIIVDGAAAVCANAVDVGEPRVLVGWIRTLVW